MKVEALRVEDAGPTVILSNAAELIEQSESPARAVMVAIIYENGESDVVYQPGSLLSDLLFAVEWMKLKIHDEMRDLR